MNLAYRRLAYSVAFLLFFVIGTTAVLFASGQRYDARTHSIVRVGAIYIKSFPAGASIFLNDKKTGKVTPNRLLNVIPGKSTIRVERPGFKPWEKTLDVQPGTTTFVRDIVLFKENQAEHVLGTGGESVLISDDHDIYVFLDKEHHVTLTNTNTRNTFTLSLAVTPDQLLALSPTKDTVAVRIGNRLYTINLNTEVATPIATRAFRNLKKIQWDPTNPDKLWILDGGTLYSITGTNATTTHWYDAVDDIYITADYITTLKHDTAGYFLQLYNYEGGEARLTRRIDTNNQPMIDRIQHDLITVANKTTIWLVPTERSRQTRSFEATSFAWHDTRLLMSNDYEIYIYATDTNTLELVDRSTQRIDSVDWHPSGSYFVRSVENIISLAELDSRDHRNTITIATTKNPAALIFDKKGSSAFVLTPQSNSYFEIQ